MKEQKDSATTTDIRPLRQAIHDLADTVDELVEEFDTQAKGQGPPEHAQKARDKVQEIREAVPEAVAERESIETPWEREGYDSKQAWLDDK